MGSLLIYLGIKILMCLSVSAISDDVRNCTCNKYNMRTGFFGIYPFNEAIDDKLPLECKKYFLGEKKLIQCWNLLLNRPYESEIDVNEGIGIEMIEREDFLRNYNFSLNMRKINSMIEEFPDICVFIRRLKCVKYIDVFKGVKIVNEEAEEAREDVTVSPTSEVENVDTEHSISHSDPTGHYRETVTNIFHECSLSEERGPATCPEKTVLLYGHTGSRLYNKIDVYFIMDSYKYNFRRNCVCFYSISAKKNNLYIAELNCGIPEDREECYIDYNSVKVTLNRGMFKGQCAHSSSYIKRVHLRELLKTSSVPERTIMVCTNGTIMDMGKTTIRSSINTTNNICTPIALTERFSMCIGQSEEFKCVIKGADMRSTVIINQNIPASVHITTDEEDFKLDCGETCEFQPKEGITWMVVTCQNGHKRKFSRETNEINCPWIDKVLPDKFAIYICRATHHPNTLIVLIILFCCAGWLPGLIYYVVDLFLYIITILFNILTRGNKRGLGFEPCLCEYCEEPVDSRLMSERHVSCVNNICPYCRSVFSELKKHCNTCRLKESVNKKLLIEIDNELKKSGAVRGMLLGFPRRSHWSSRFPKISMYIVLIILIIVVLSPVKANEYNVSKLNEWIEYQKMEDGCVSEKFHSDQSCPDDHKIMLSSIRLNGDRESIVSHLPSISHEETFKPVESDRNVELIMNTRYEGGGKVALYGSTNSIMELEDNTALTYTITNPDSDEKLLLTVAIKQHGQIYKSKFNYFYSDRKVLLGADNTCTKECEGRCGCRSSTCRIMKKDNIRNWRCNPTWCWAVGEGCSCCYMYATLSNMKYLIAEFEMEYLESFVDICISINHKKFKCKEYGHGTSFNDEGISFKLTKIYNVNKKLSKKVHAYYKATNGGFDLVHPDGILIDADICTASNCRHGEVGDYRFKSVKLLDEDAHNDVNYGVEMIWNGVQQGMDCVSFHWPDCTAEGLTVQTTDMFENLIKITKKVNDDFKILQSRMIKDDSNNIALDLIVSPKINAGMIQVFTSVNGYKINSRKTKKMMDRFKIKQCVGCRNCYKGFHCEVELSLLEPEEALVHISAKHNFVTTGEQSLVIKKEPMVYNVSMFSPLKVTEIELCIEEFSLCKVYKGINLTEPINRLTNQGIFVKKKTRDLGGFSLQGIGKYFQNFFTSIWALIKSLFDNWWIYLLIILLIIYILLIQFSKAYIGPTKINAKKRKFNKQV